MKFLIVDDDNDCLQFISMLVTEHCPSAVISLARNGAEALAVAAGEVLPEIVFTDIAMPILDGNGLCGALRAIHGNAMKIIAMTGTPTSVIDADFDAILVKPFTAEAVNGIIDGIFGGTGLDSS